MANSQKVGHYLDLGCCQILRICHLSPLLLVHQLVAFSINTLKTNSTGDKVAIARKVLVRWTNNKGDRRWQIRKRWHQDQVAAEATGILRLASQDALEVM